MPNRINLLLVKEYKERFSNGANIVSIGYEGLNVENTNLLRAQLEEREVGLLFVKNRIVNIAFKEMDRPNISPICNGQTAFAFGEDPVAIARFLVDFRKEHNELKLHGAYVEGTVIDEAGVVDLSKSPTKEELKGQISGLALSPGARIGGALKGPAGIIAGQVKGLIEKLEDGGEAA